MTETEYERQYSKAKKYFGITAAQITSELNGLDVQLGRKSVCRFAGEIMIELRELRKGQDDE